MEGDTVSDNIKSRRGVYYDLTRSPYEYKSPYGDLFKFSSAKKLEIYRRDIIKEVTRFRDLTERNNLKRYIDHYSFETIERGIYKAFYKVIEGKNGKR